MKFLAFRQTKLGSSFDITRAWVGGASVIPLLSSLLFSVPPSRRKVLGAKPKLAGKKEGGWGEGIFARQLPFPFRLRKGKAEGGFGGNSAFPLRNQIEASPATCPNTWRAEHRRKILFSLKEERIGGAQNEKSKEYFSVVWRACRAVAGLASLVGGLLKKSSNFNQKTPPIFTFCEIVRIASAQSASAWYFSAILKAFLKSKNKVRSAMRKFAVRSTGKMKFCKPIFFLSPLAKG
jgi:hypothetical protein